MEINDSAVASQYASKRDRLFWLFLIVSMPVSYFVFSVGLDSPFIFDDFPNLSTLSELSGVAPFSQDFFSFVFAGMSGPTGRPISLFTFALQAGHWPSDPYYFKLVNLLIHLCNGLLFFLIASLILKLKKLDDDWIRFVCYLVIALWLFHPIHTSTVFLAVQRMTQLSSFFILLAIAGYILGRRMVVAGQVYRGLIVILSFQAFGGISAILSKEIGVLLLVYLLVIELTVFQDHALLDKKQLLWLRLWRIGCLISPILLVLIYFTLWFDSAVASAYSIREFTPLERVLTESRVLWLYVFNLLMPVQGSFGLATEIPISKNLLEPMTTALSILAWVVVVVAAVLLRRKIPVFSVCVFWFLGGHVLESSIIGLELYFDHRNYLPSLGVIGLLVYLVYMTFKMAKLKPAIFIGLVFSIGVYFSWISFQVAHLWTQPVKQAQVWYEHNPNSKRAMQFLGSAYYRAGALDGAIAIYQKMAKSNTTALEPLFYWLHIACEDARYQAPSREFFEKPLAHSKRFFYDNQVLESLTTRLLTDGCPGEIRSTFMSVISTALEQEKFNFHHGILSFHLARLLAHDGALTASEPHFKRAFELTGNAGVLFVFGHFLLNAGHSGHALEQFKKAKEALLAQPIVEQQKLDMLNLAIQQLEG